MVEVPSLKMESACSSATLVITCKPTQCHNPEDHGNCSCFSSAEQTNISLMNNVHLLLQISWNIFNVLHIEQ
jgi:hypothetical protein